MITYVAFALLVLAVVLVLATAGRRRRAPLHDDLPGQRVPVLHIEQDPKFPRERWVRTTLFDRRTPYIGFTYLDPGKGNCIKGEDVSGLDDAAIKAKLGASFPSSTMAAIPLGHPIQVLSADEIAKYGLPAAPAWLAYYK
ncbi:MAG: hypothetical protein KIT31_25050 [Deltaproteobacteria bacterium]|nr:hypothetical protein [Deltaproteobacteria bacterium]